MDRICNLYIDKIHLSVTLFEYIKKEIDKGTRVIVVSQDDIRKDIKSIKKKFSEKRVCSKINYLNEIDQNALEKLENVSVIIQGDAEFVEKTERLFSEMFSNENIKVNIVSCYNITQNINVPEVVDKYDKILSTNGIENIKSKQEEKNRQNNNFI